ALGERRREEQGPTPCPEGESQRSARCGERSGWGRCRRRGLSMQAMLPPGQQAYTPSCRADAAVLPCRVSREAKEGPMTTYVILGSWTDQGVRAIKDSPRRLDAAKAVLKEMGGEVKSFHMTMGDH